MLGALATVELLVGRFDERQWKTTQTRKVGRNFQMKTTCELNRTKLVWFSYCNSFARRSF